MRTTNRLPALGAILAMALVLGLTSDASAAHHPGPAPSMYHRPPPPPSSRHGGYDYRCNSRGSFGLFFAPRPSGYYQTVTETVLVEPERVEPYWVPPVYSTVTNAYGQPQTVLVRDGYMAQRVVPARYATVQRQVWVPYGNSGVRFGLGFRF